jgi:hypothetical protein
MSGEQRKIDRLFSKQRNLRKGGGGDGADDLEYFADLSKKKPTGGGALKNKGGLNIAPFISTLAILGTRLLKDEKFMKNSNFKLLSSTKSKSKSTKSKSKSKSKSKMSGGEGEDAVGAPTARTNLQSPELPTMAAMGESFAAGNATKMTDRELNQLQETIANNQQQQQQITGGKKRRSTKKSTTKKSTTKKSTTKKTQKKCAK